VSYASVESTRRNAPIECYAFARDDQAWYYTTHDVDVTRNGETYRAALMERDAFRQSEEGEQISVTLRIANETPLAEEIRAVGLPSTRGVMMMRLIATHAGSSDIIVPFLGRVTGYQMLATNVSLTVESEQALFKQKILRVIGGVQCNHDLYGPGCGVNMEDHRYECTITAADGSRTVTISFGAADGVLAGGILWVGRDRYFIEQNEGSVLTLLTRAPASLVGESAAVFEGCDRSYPCCRDRFDNTRRFGGFPKFPINNPFLERQVG
jgi:hypothetical protein